MNSVRMTGAKQREVACCMSGSSMSMLYTGLMLRGTDQRVCKPLTHTAGQRRSLLLVPKDKLVFTKLLAVPRHPWKQSLVFQSAPQPRSGALYFPASAAANCSSELGDCRRYKCAKQRLTARVECVAVRRNLQAPSPLRQPPCR